MDFLVHGHLIQGVLEGLVLEVGFFEVGLQLIPRQLGNVYAFPSHGNFRETSVTNGVVMRLNYYVLYRIICLRHKV